MTEEEIEKIKEQGRKETSSKGGKTTATRYGSSYMSALAKIKHAKNKKKTPNIDPL